LRLAAGLVARLLLRTSGTAAGAAAAAAAVDSEVVSEGCSAETLPSCGLGEAVRRERALAMTSLALLAGVATAVCRRCLHVRLLRLCSCMVAALNDCTSIDQTDLPDS
jgi:hypothetical protein